MKIFPFAHKMFLLLCGIPLLLFIGLGFFVIPTQEDFIRESLNFILNTGVLVGILGVLPNKRLRSKVAFLGLTLLNLLSFVKLSFYYTYQTKLSASALFVIFETNKSEASSYISAYTNGFSIGLLFLLLFYTVFAWRLLFQKKYHFSFREFPIWIKGSIKVAMFLGLMVSLYCISWKFSDYNLFYKANLSYKEYQDAKALIRKDLAKQTSTVFQSVSLSEQAPETAIVIIGESTTRTHMGLYGYERNTNPKLQSIRNELGVFKDVISPHVHTITALNEILTLTSSTKDSLAENASIIQLANAAGYETYWISNQRPVGVFESIPTLIGYGAKHKKFINTNDYNRQSYDEVLLPELSKVLKEPTTKRKMIFLHLMGTHVGYAERYPSNFKLFKDQPKTKYNSSKAYQSINEYDNSVRYNDSIVFEVIQQAKQLNNKAYVLYFSDHGDDVFEHQEKVGHSEYVASAPMYEVPFLIWSSKSFRRTQPLLQDASIENRSYMLDEFIHSFADISGIYFKNFQSQKSIFNDSFQVRKRRIKDNEWYEERFKK